MRLTIVAVILELPRSCLWNWRASASADCDRAQGAVTPAVTTEEWGERPQTLWVSGHPRLRLRHPVAVWLRLWPVWTNTISVSSLQTLKQSQKVLIVLEKVNVALAGGSAHRDIFFSLKFQWSDKEVLSWSSCDSIFMSSCIVPAARPAVTWTRPSLLETVICCWRVLILFVTRKKYSQV